MDLTRERFRALGVVPPLHVQDAEEVVDVERHEPRLLAVVGVHPRLHRAAVSVLAQVAVLDGTEELGLERRYSLGDAVIVKRSDRGVDEWRQFVGALHLVLPRRGRADLKLARCAPFSASEARVTVAKLAVEHRARAKLDARATRAQLAVV